MSPVTRFEGRFFRTLLGLPPSLLGRVGAPPALPAPPAAELSAPLDPHVRAILALRRWRGYPAGLTRSTPERTRAFMRQQNALARRRPTPVGTVRDLTVTGAAGRLPARHYVPADAGDDLPILLFFHGGGFVSGDLDTHDEPCRLLCKHAGVQVLSVAYRLAPEHPFPAGLDDAVAAYAWTVRHAAPLGADPARIAIGGDSAGANLATVVCQLVAGAARGDATADAGDPTAADGATAAAGDPTAADGATAAAGDPTAADGSAAAAGQPPPAAQLLLYPPTHRGGDWPSRRAFADGLLLTGRDIEFFHSNYGATQPEDFRHAPLLGTVLGDLPPAIVVTAAFDPLRDEGEAYADAMRAAGTKVHAWRVPGLVHGFANLTTLSPAAHAATVEVAHRLAELLGPAPSKEAS
jgi:acetyl esterase